MSAPGLFEFLKNIGERGGNPDILLDPEALKAYSPFMVNRGLAQNIGTLAIADALNRGGVIDKQMHYAFAFYATPKAKRYNAWAKKTPPTDDFLFIREVYQCNEERALEILKLITADELAQLKRRHDKGGTTVEAKPTKTTKAKKATAKKVK